MKPYTGHDKLTSLMVNKKTTRNREKLGQVEKICMRYENTV